MTNATYQTAAGSLLNPTGTVSTSVKMMGLGSTIKLTPTYSGRVQVTISGFLQNTLSGNSANAQLYFGTSTAPSNGVSVTGTAVGAVLIGGATCTSCNWAIPMTLTAVITGLTPGTAYWFDVGLLSGNASGTSIIGNVAGTIVEF